VHNGNVLLETDSCKAFLEDEFIRRTQVNPRYSQRAFAKQLGMSAGELSEVLRGKRNLSLKSAFKIARKLGLSTIEVERLIHLTQVEKARKVSDHSFLLERVKTPDSKQLTLDVFRIVSDWFCFAILNLAETKGFHLTPCWIAKRLGITRTEAQIGIERLKRVGLVEEKMGQWEVNTNYVLSPCETPSEAIRSYHKQILGRALEALETQSVSERDFSGIGFAVHPKHLSAIKKEISDFQDQLVAKYSKGTRTEVYFLECSLFRLTQAGDSHEDLQ